MYKSIFLTFFLISQLSAQNLTNKRDISAIHDDDYVSIEDKFKKTPTVQVKEEFPIYKDSAFTQAIGTMPAGTTVKLAGMIASGAFKVRGKARHGDVAGWLPHTAIQSPSPDFFKNAKAFYDRERLINQCLINKQVAIGMTEEEVRICLGKPDSTNKRVTASGQQLTHHYIQYQRIPQYQTQRDAFGQIYQTVTYIKVESGRLQIDYQNGLVTIIEEYKDNTLQKNPFTIIPPINWFGF
jgi:hypothetical protein